MMSRKMARLNYLNMIGLKNMKVKRHEVTSNYFESNLCSLPLWINHMIKNYGLKSKVLTVFCDNLSAKNISKNPIQHPCIKQNDIRHHFIRDLIEQKIISIEYVRTKKQLADIFTKFIDFKRLYNLKKSLCLCFI